LKLCKNITVLNKIFIKTKKNETSSRCFSTCGVGILIHPEKAKAVQNFEKEKYLGKWYEIARLILNSRD
jgi:lipocalin